MGHSANPKSSGSAPSHALICSRLDAIRLALGAERLAVVRRNPGAAEPSSAPLQVLGQVDGAGTVDPPEKGLPLEFVLDLVAQARALEFECDTAPGRWAERLRSWEVGWIAGWPLPSDRLPSVFFVAMRRAPREPGVVRREVARAGMEALARLLAPPRWLPLGAPPKKVPSEHELPASGLTGSGEDTPAESGALVDILARVEREVLVGALQAAEGNKSLAARKLRVSRQGLYRKLRRHGLMRRRVRSLDSGCGDD